MNTNILKRFAQTARRKLIEQVGAKLEQVINTDSAELREKAGQLKKLQEAINSTSKEQVIDKVAYTWFNRLMALRFMDANDFQPIGIRVITPKDGYTLPELLDEAKQGNIPDELPVKTEHIYDLLDGKVPGTNPQNEAYKELLIGACNHLNKVFPFLFERINDYTELLMPDDLISEFSIVQDIREGMTTEDCQEVEIIGWLYQFYISERKNEIFASKSKVKKEDIPAATQLFTPRWIVEYMVQNTVGKLWLQNKPDSKLREHMPYFIESPSVTSDGYLKVNSVEEITLLDQACGSGHILVYGFELFTKIYEEEGYNPSEIPQLIIKKNLFGFEIDERASQLAGMALMMKARNYQRRVFRKELKPNILCYSDLKLTTDEIKQTFNEIGADLSDDLLDDLKNMQQATNLGSLIIPHSKLVVLERTLEHINLSTSNPDVFLAPKLETLKKALNQLVLLSNKYHCVVDNPPYMGRKKMNGTLSDFVNRYFPDSKPDLMACFMEAGLSMLKNRGFLGMINQHSWMFIKSFEKMRFSLISNILIDTLLHLGTRTFPEIGGEVVQNTSFTLLNSRPVDVGCFYNLTNYDSSNHKEQMFKLAVENPNCGYFHKAQQQKFISIPGSPIGYWLSKKTQDIFESEKQLKDVSELRQGLATADNDQFLRYWFEVRKNNFGNQNLTRKIAETSNKRWFPYAKGGSYRKWFGNNEFVVDWGNDGQNIKADKLEKLKMGKCLESNSKPKNMKYYFKEALTWSLISGSGFGVRYRPEGEIFDVNGMSLFHEKPTELKKILLCLNSNVTYKLLKTINPTLAFQKGDIEKLPFKLPEIETIDADTFINISKMEWDTRETSWDFEKNELIRFNDLEIEGAYDLYQQHWRNKFFQLHKNEEELNRQFIKIYGLQKELTPDVPLEDITILKDELNQKELKKLSDNFSSGWALADGKFQITNNNPLLPDLPFNVKEVMAQFISYAVGCMFGRYSLDKDGLILANQGETLDDYYQKLELKHEELGNLKSNTKNLTPSFLPDDDNIIPVLDGDWFEDDITGRFYEFLKVTFGKENFDKNLAFVEESLGKDIRKYFIKDFYPDHIKRYKKRPIYWMFSSPKASFNVLIYMHRYTPDTLNQILNGYLKEYKEKLNSHMEQLDHIIVTGSSAEQTKAAKEKDKLKLVLLELQEYERDILYPLATERIAIDLDDGVLVNYNKFGTAIKSVAGLNDKKTKDKVRKFDWIDVEEIRG